MIRRTRRLLLTALALLALGACSTNPPAGLSAVEPFDLARYLGKWYEIARLDHRFERGMSDVSATYSLRSDGSVEVLNRGYDSARQDWRQATGHALFTGPSERGSLKVSFFGPFYGGYHVVALDPAYRWALVVGPDRDYFWILARERALAPELRAQLVEKSRALGIDVDRLIWVDQTRSDGRSGCCSEFAIASMRAASPALRVRPGSGSSPATRVM